MNPIIVAFKDWFPAIGALFAVMVGAAYTVAAAAQVSGNIQEMKHLGAALTDTATGVEIGVLSSEQIEIVQSRRRDLEGRMNDSHKQGLVVSQLSEAARKAGLAILEILPIRSSGAAVRHDDLRTSPIYRVSLRGKYRQIAEYMQNCTGQRIPVRVIGFRITPVQPENGQGRAEILRAKITVEVFLSPSPAIEKLKGGAR